MIAPAPNTLVLNPLDYVVIPSHIVIVFSANIPVEILVALMVLLKYKIAK